MACVLFYLLSVIFLVLRLMRSSCGVYKTVTGMCSAFLSLILLRFRVIVLQSRPAGVAATE